MFRGDTYKLNIIQRKMIKWGRDLIPCHMENKIKILKLFNLEVEENTLRTK